MSPNMPFPLAPLTIVVGHYGVGKTNFSLNIALDAAQAGSTSEEEGQGGRAREARAESQGGRAREARAKLIDLDVVNPYFRSSDHRGLLERQGIQLISPCFAGSALDVPSLSAAIMPAIEAADAHCPVIIDAGGDDQGAVALGRFANQIARRPYAMLSVVNAYRNLTRDAASAVQILHEIEAQSGLAATGLVNNSHLQGETSLAAIEASFPFAEEAARLLRLPLVCTTFPAGLFETEAREGHHEGGGTPGREGHHEGEGFPDKKGFLKREGFPADGCNPRTRGAYGGSVPEKTVRLSKYAAQKPYLVRIYVRTPWE